MFRKSLQVYVLLVFSFVAVLLPSVLTDGYGHSSHGIGTACIVKVKVR